MDRNIHLLNNTSEKYNENKGASHQILLKQRKDCKLTGVVKVNSFDEHTVVMETVEGVIVIKGDSLHVSRVTLENNEADVEGRIDSLTYTDIKTFAQKGEGLLVRLFR